MSDTRHEIGDDEIRIISPGNFRQPGNGRDGKPSRWKRRVLWIVLAALSVALLTAFAAVRCTGGEERELVVVPLADLEPVASAVTDSLVPLNEQAFVEARDTVVGGTVLRILTPVGAVPELVIGPEALSDSTAVLVAQAADVRGDNGQIAGAYVMRGDLLSRGEAKAGFCAIINGEVTVGVADATPMLEQAIESEGYFFRQFPLVVGAQIVENKPRGRALRKALAEIDGHISVVLSLDRLTFHDFSRALVDAGVRNAVYLVGSTAAGFYVDSAGTRFNFGTPGPNDWENINYIVWR